MERDTPETIDTRTQDASTKAVHAASNAAQSLENARELQLERTVEATAQRTREALLEVLKEVFGSSDSGDPSQMRILVRRIPIICSDIAQMHSDIGDIKDNLKWAVRIIIGAVLLAGLKLIFIPGL